MPLDTSTYALSLLRLDGRRWNELRRMTGSLSTQAAADGSSYLEVGNTKVLCTVNGPAEVRQQQQQQQQRAGGGASQGDERAGLSVNISVAGFASSSLSAGGGGIGSSGSSTGTTDRRLAEMQATVQATLVTALFLERYPRSSIRVACHVLAADGGVMAACINAATLALVDAGIPMADYVCACSAGSTANNLAYAGGGGGVSGVRSTKDNTSGGNDNDDDSTSDPLLDLNAQEELELPHLTVATVGASERMAGLTLATRVHVQRIESMLAVAVDGCKQVREILDGIVCTHGRRLLALDNSGIPHNGDGDD